MIPLMGNYSGNNYVCKTAPRLLIFVGLGLAPPGTLLKRLRILNINVQTQFKHDSRPLRFL